VSKIPFSLLKPLYSTTAARSGLFVSVLCKIQKILFSFHPLLNPAWTHTHTLGFTLSLLALLDFGTSFVEPFQDSEQLFVSLCDSYSLSSFFLFFIFHTHSKLKNLYSIGYNILSLILSLSITAREESSKAETVSKLACVAGTIH